MISPSKPSPEDAQLTSDIDMALCETLNQYISSTNINVLMTAITGFVAQAMCTFGEKEMDFQTRQVFISGLTLMMNMIRDIQEKE